MSKNLEKASKPIIEELKKLKEVKVVCFYGGMVKGDIDKYSDIDICCFCTKKPPVKSRQEILRKLGTKSWSLRDKYDAFLFNGNEFVILYITIEEVEKNLKHFLKEKNEWFEKDFESMVVETKLSYDPKGILKRWKKRIGKYPDWLKKRNLNSLSRARRMLEELPKSLYRDNKILIDFALVYSLEDLIHAIYALNEKYYSTPKWFAKDLKTFKIKPKNCKKRFDMINGLDNKRDLLKKVKLIHNLITDVEKIANKKVKGLKIMRRPTSTESVIKDIKKLQHF